MNTTQLKTYGPKARRDFIAAVTDRAALFGLTRKEIAPVIVKGDVAIISGQALPREVAAKRARLEERIQRDGFDQVMEAMAYTWFNRLMAIRYMELHGYLEHGYRVLSHPEGKVVPEILEHAAEVDLPGLDREAVVELKLDGTKDEELYRLLLLAQCHALHKAMPFLFESLDDESELLLPDRLLHTDSLIRKLVEEIAEGAWESIQIVGWLYQFYISEKKDQVIGKVVKSEDIPAATQLFTPNWIVKYLIQNSLGAQWLATYPQSPLKGQMEYYIEPAEQTDEVKAQLAAITPSTLNPEELTLIDPACGSGHILVEAYELFKAIYLERGYRQRDVPKLILEKNLFGLEICPRAAQLTGFALMMKGRADDRRLFERGVMLNVMALVNSAGFDVERLAKGVELGDYGLELGDLSDVRQLFQYATTLGSLVHVPEGLTARLPALKQLSEASSLNLFVSDAIKRLAPLVRQAELLSLLYDSVVANPPYMGGRYMNPEAKRFATEYFQDAKNDLFACFIERGGTLAKASGHNAMVTMQSWMFLSSFETMRERLLREKSIQTMAHMSNGVMGIAFGTAATVLRNRSLRGYAGSYSHTSVADLDALGAPREFPVRNNRLKEIVQDEFDKIPGSPVAYWVSERVRAVFRDSIPLSKKANFACGMTTGDNGQFVRLWQEVDYERSGYGIQSAQQATATGKKWFPYNKGGEFRKWFGNNTHVVNWESDGRDILTSGRAYPRAQDCYFRQSTTWSFISSSYFGVRYSDFGAIFDMGGCSAFPFERAFLKPLCAFLCSNMVFDQLKVMNPTLNFQVGNVGSLPWLRSRADAIADQASELADRSIDVSRTDWNAYERSWDFQSHPILKASTDPAPTLESSFTAWRVKNRETIAEMKRLEEENNRLFIDAYGLGDELNPDAPIEQITLTVNPAYRYGGKLSEEEQWNRFREDTMQELLSYSIGCMMGRYSLDAPGLIYAHSGNEGFDSGKYSTFPADKDGIVPLTELAWFEDGAAQRVEQFILVAWEKANLEENLAFLAANLAPRAAESSRETIRRYLATQFFKDHLQTYKKRPIYWLFSSGKERAFQSLVYLHRYHEGTLGRMRTEYVIPLQGRMASRIQQLEGDIAGATSTPHSKRLEKERETLLKQRVELQEFDEKLLHYADQRIRLDLDDGVKVNYGKFGNLLAEVKTVTGEDSE